MKYFFDNNLSKNLSDGLKSFGENVIHLQELYKENTEDIIWLKDIGNMKMILITKDERIRKNPFELRAIKEYEVGAFFLGGKKSGRCKIIQQVVRNWSRIKEFSSKLTPPFAFRIPPAGTKFEKIPL